jgi:hypothetical protein
LHIPRRSNLAYFVHLTTAFALSCFFHILAFGAVSPGFFPLDELVKDLSLFFALQILGTTAESIVIGQYSRYVENHRLIRQQKQPASLAGSDDEQTALLATTPDAATNKRTSTLSLMPLSPMFCRIVGYLWVSCWLFLTGRLFVKACLGIRVRDWHAPYSLLEKLFGPPR